MVQQDLTILISEQRVEVREDVFDSMLMSRLIMSALKVSRALLLFIVRGALPDHTLSQSHKRVLPVPEFQEFQVSHKLIRCLLNPQSNHPRDWTISTLDDRYSLLAYTWI